MVAGGVSLVAPLTLGGHGSVLWAAASMVAFAVLWTLFALEDGALIAVHGAWAVLVSNVAFGVAKLIMLVLLPVDGQVDTVLWSWYAPLLVVVPLTNLALLARLRRDRTEAPNAEPVRLARFVTVDYASFLIVQVITTALPVYVVMIAGPESAAVFATCWMVAGSLDLAITNIAIAMSANIARRPAEAARLMRSVALRMAVPMIVIVGLLIVAAPWVLAVFGPRYASDGPPILRLLLLASLLRAVVTFCSATTRSLRRPGTVILMQVTAAAVILGVGLPAMRQWGVLALAVAWLAAQAASAVVSVLLTRRVVRQTSARSTAEPPVAAPR
jgi:O-antigen/teichoic acid export membrane protein